MIDSVTGSEFRKIQAMPSLLYSSRRKFLASAGKSALEPPLEFKTRRQARRSFLQAQESDLEFDESNPDSFLLYLQKLQKQNSQKAAKKEMFQNLLPAQKKLSDQPLVQRVRRAGKLSLGVVVLDSGLDGNIEDWEQEYSAGVNYWVNKGTGEVSTESPFLQKGRALMQISGSRKRLISAPMVPYEEDLLASSSSSQLPGTGALVYDRSEVDELFKLLDSVESSKKAVLSLNSPSCRYSSGSVKLYA